MSVGQSPRAPRAAAGERAAAVPAAIRGILACPKCHGSLQDAADPSGPSLVCASCALRYPVRDGLPILLVEQAERVSV